MEKYLLSETQLKYIIEESFNNGEQIGRERTSDEIVKEVLLKTQTDLLTAFNINKS